MNETNRAMVFTKMEVIRNVLKMPMIADFLQLQSNQRPLDRSWTIDFPPTELARYQRNRPGRTAMPACEQTKIDYHPNQQGGYMAVGFFKTLKLSMSGTLLKRVDAHIESDTKASMKLKFDRATGRRYVFLNLTSGGSTDIRAYEVDEFLEITDKLSLAIKEMRAAVLA